MSGKILLTGISGWIAKHTAIELLNAGYEVLGTIRNNNLVDQTKQTVSKYASTEKLSFVELDLLKDDGWNDCLLYTSPSPRDKRQSRMPSSA